MKPGNNAAIREGCTCPIHDNGHGKGAYGDGDKYGFWINGNCPLHKNKFPALSQNQSKHLLYLVQNWGEQPNQFRDVAEMVGTKEQP